MRLTRRALLQTGSASIVIAASGCALPPETTRNAFREPWSAASRGFNDARLNALAYAILAPNPHNRQPWLVSLDDDLLGFALFCDLERRLPQTDPHDHQTVIGLGAFLELFRQAAAQQGYRAIVTPFPAGEPQPRLNSEPFARVRLTADTVVEPNPLFNQVLARRTARIKFSDKPITAQTLNQIRQTAVITPHNRFSSTVDATQIANLKDLCVAGWKIEVANHATHMESVELTRIGAEEVSKNPDGVSLLGPMMETAHAVGLLSRDKMKTPGTLAYKGALSFYNELITSASAFGWLSTPGNTRLDQLNAGADWVKLNLATTKLGVAMHPLSQVLQEFPAMSHLFAAVHQQLGVESPARVQGLFRFGFAERPKAAPRWALTSRITNLG